MAEVISGKEKKLRIFPLILLAVGALLAAAQLLYNAGTLIQAAFIKIEHPAVYRFVTYNQLLKAYVRDELVDYRGLKKDEKRLKQCVDELARVSPDHLQNRTEELCFWINAYNLLVLKNIVDRYPIRSTRAIANSFSLRDFLVGGKPYSVEKIEMLQLRRLLSGQDGRILFTVCGGARGYPPLLDHALEPARLTNDFEQACVKFINTNQNVYFDEDSDTLLLSPFFKWNENLLAKGYGSSFHFVNNFLSSDRKVKLEDIHVKRSFMVNFNWWLNDTASGALKR
jgi:hypothetical protein